MKALRLFGQFKYPAMRVGAYVQIFNMVLLIVGFGWQWWYWLAMGGFVLAFLFEVKHGIPGEMDVAWKNSREWQEFKSQDEEFKKEVRRWMTM